MIHIFISCFLSTAIYLSHIYQIINYCFWTCFSQVLIAAAVLFYPGLILIDHGHFQYPLPLKVYCVVAERYPPLSGNSNLSSHITLNFWIFWDPCNFQFLLLGKFGYFLELHRNLLTLPWWMAKNVTFNYF